MENKKTHYMNKTGWTACGISGERTILFEKVTCKTCMKFLRAQLKKHAAINPKIVDAATDTQIFALIHHERMHNAVFAGMQKTVVRKMEK